MTIREIFEKVKCSKCEHFRISIDKEITYCEEGTVESCYREYLESLNEKMLEALKENKKLICQLCERIDPIMTRCLICGGNAKRNDLISQIEGKELEGKE
jgi:hypothetical protein